MKFRDEIFNPFWNIFKKFWIFLSRNEAEVPPSKRQNMEKSVKFDENAKNTLNSEKPNEKKEYSQKDYQANDLDCAKGMVLKVLSPYFTAGRFKEKPLFKEMAKLLTKCLFEASRGWNFINFKKWTFFSIF